jgi:penicillin-binding protein 2
MEWKWLFKQVLLQLLKLKTLACAEKQVPQNPHGKDHSVFVAFAPRENPKIAIAVVVENAGFGGTWAAPIASLIIEKYLTDSISRPHIEERMLNANLMQSK